MDDNLKVVISVSTYYCIYNRVQNEFSDHNILNCASVIVDI